MNELFFYLSCHKVAQFYMTLIQQKHLAVTGSSFGLYTVSPKSYCFWGLTLKLNQNRRVVPLK